MQPTDNPYRLTFTVAEAAEILGISRGLVYEAIKRKEIAALRFGTRCLIPRTVLEDLIGEKIEVLR